MKIKFMAIASAILLVVGFSLIANAGAVLDTDGDTVPDAFDICPAQPDPAQADADGDGIGNACDCDFLDPAPGDGFVLGNDIVDMLNNFGSSSSPVHDLTLDGFVLGDDIVFCLNRFGLNAGENP